MKADWALPLRIETKTAQIMFEMEQYVWLVHVERIHELIADLAEKILAIDDVVLPRIPMRVKSYGVEVVKPFNMDGQPSAKVQEFWGDEVELVSGPHCRIIWEVINLGSDKQVKEYLLSVGWKPLEWNYSKKTGAVTSPKLTEESFDSLSDDTGKLVAERMKYKHRKSQLEGWLKVVREDGRIAQIISGLTPTGRYTHKQIVNVPGEDAVYGPEMRSVFIAKPGYKIVGCDAKSCQLRMLCHYMEDEEYTHAVLHGKKEDGTDIHSVNMAKTGGMITVRRIVKSFIYGLLFGAQDPKLGAILGGTPADGRRLRAEFMRNLPALQRLVDGLLKAWEARGYLVGIDGRKLRIRAKHMTLVYLLQCAEAVLMKVAICLLDDWIKKEGLDAHFVAFVHDEVQLEVREDQADRVAKLAERAVASAGEFLGLKVPSAGDAAIGNTWGDTH